MNSIRFISFWTGFCSLSFEIAWIRLYGYINLSTPKAFAYVLIVYLLGIACGAQIGKKVCGGKTICEIKRIGVFSLLFAAAVAAIAPWVAYYSRQWSLDDLLTPLVIFSTSAALAILFPITHHLGTPTDEISNSRGRHFSTIYLLNVIGAALGPLVTGYILFEYITLTQIFTLVSFIVAGVAAIAWFKFGFPLGERRFILSILVVLCLLGSLSIFGSIQPHALVRNFANVTDGSVVAVHEGRHGIVTIAEQIDISGEASDFVVYGGNVYDGKTNVDLEKNSNGLERPLALHVLKPDAKKVLILGLSIGSWLTIVEGFPGVQKIDVVEINPGYLKLAEEFSPQRRALNDPRVSIYIDDARRWLRLRQEVKYDIILMNTTWHWRANSAMLLSKEMLLLASSRLTNEGVVAFNATGSVDSFYTASKVFNEARRYVNFIYGANWNAFDVVENPLSWDRLRNVTVDGHAGFLPDSKKIEIFSKIPFVKIQDDLKNMDRAPEEITDDNMIVEYKYGKK